MSTAVEITSLDDITAATVQQIHAELSQMLQEKHPEVEVSLGVTHNLILYFSAVFDARTKQELERYLNSRSLKAIEEDPTLADDDLVDHIMSNYQVTRGAGAAAAGTITVVVAQDIATVIPAGLRFTANGLAFAVGEAYVARESDTTPSGTNEVSLSPRGDGTYAFSVPATCVTTGVAGNLKRGTKMVPASPPGNFVTAYAGNDFAGGSATETNAELLTRLQEGIAAKAWSNAINISAMLKEQAAFANTLDYSVVGYGFPEQMRDQHTVIPVSGGGKTDLYCRTAATPLHETVRKTATFVSNTGEGSIWQFTLARDDSPGFYEVDRILLPTDDPTSGGFAVTMDLRQTNEADDSFVPDIQAATESAFSRYQTATIRFLDTETDTTDMTSYVSTQEYDVVVTRMPLIADLQTFCNGWQVRDPGGDILVKAAVPCFLSVSFNIQQARTETAPDTDAIKLAIADRVNLLGFPGQLHASTIADAAHDFLTSRQAIPKIDLHGRILRPDLTNVYLRDFHSIQVPNDPLNLVTGRTVAFILDPNDIAISVLTEGFTDRM